MRTWVAGNGATGLMVLVGVFLIAAGVGQDNARNSVASTMILVGGGLIAVGIAPSIPRLREWSMSKEGLTMKLDPHPPAAVELAAAIPELVAAQASELDEPDEIIEGYRFLLARVALQTLLQPPETSVLKGSHLYLYLYDADAEELVAVAFGDEGPELDRWKPGRGATGTAWLTEQYVVATGDVAHDETHGLTPAQQRRYAALTAVAAMPVTNAADRVIAVLSASSEDPDTHLGTDEAFQEHLFRAGLVARVLVDVLQWASDD